MFDFFAAYRNPVLPSPGLIHPLEGKVTIRGNMMYLSLFDAVALAIENNISVEVNRYQLSIADTDILRAKGGGVVRGLDYTIFESPVGVGGVPAVLPGLTGTTSPALPTVTDMSALNHFVDIAAPWTVHGPTGYSGGPAIPAYDAALIGQSAWYRRGNTIALVLDSFGTPAPLRNFDYTATNLAFVKGFSSGGQLELMVNNASNAIFGSNNNFNPFGKSNLSLTFAQPLLRGRGREVNRRYLKIAQINKNVSKLLLYQQIISTVYGVSRLYCDLVTLNENVRVKRDALAAARQVLEDASLQVEKGRLAPVELTRARALVSAAEMDLVQAEGLVSQQETILKTQITRDGLADQRFREMHIVPTDPFNIPPFDDLQPVETLISEALAARPDLKLADLQIETAETAAKGSKNALLPSVDLVANFQTRAEAQTPFQSLGTPGNGLVFPPPMLSQGGLIPSKIYQFGIQFNMPVGNRVAQADAARDALHVRQSQTRRQQLANDIRGEVHNSVIALRTSRAALDAAVQSREHQEQLLDAEKKKLSVGASTHLLLVQQQAALAQARSTEVAARNTWMKAKIALERVAGTLLQNRGVSFEDALSGRVANARTR
jgi:outer membrane protein TolC